MSLDIKSIVGKSLAQYSSNSFTPTDAHRRAKSAFWAHYFSTGDVPPSPVDSATAARFSGFNEVIEWFSGIPGFAEWFSNGEEFRQRVEYVSQLGLDVLQQVLLDSNARVGDRLAAARMALEVARKFPGKESADKFADDRISEMDRKQLEEFIASKLKNISPKE